MRVYQFRHLGLGPLPLGPGLRSVNDWAPGRLPPAGQMVQEERPTPENTVKAVSFASIGECMIELSGRDGDLWHMGFAGDTFNAAYYARAVLPADRRVGYVTALGSGDS